MKARHTRNSKAGSSVLSHRPTITTWEPPSTHNSKVALLSAFGDHAMAPEDPLGMGKGSWDEVREEPE